ncbi:MAG: GGDEF domain-containing protein [Pseudomonadota bacterium]
MNNTEAVIDSQRILKILAERNLPATPEQYRVVFIELYPSAMPDFETHIHCIAQETPSLLEAIHALLVYANHTPSGIEQQAGESLHEALLRSTLEAVHNANTVPDNHLLNLISKVLMISHSVFNAITQARQEITTAHQHVTRLKEQLNSSQQALDISLELLVQDNLTGALNRRALDHVLTREVAEPKALGHPKRVVMAMLDIDFFKKINDRYGHAVGDQALVHFCKYIRHTLRENDYLVRYGGEEFLLVMPDADIAGAQFAVERLRSTLNTTPLIVDTGEQVNLKFSAGLCSLSHEQDPYDAIRLADEALYAAKQNGRDCLKIATPAESF